MANNPETLFGIFQKYAAKKKTTFKDWCAFIAWFRKCKPNVDVLNALDALSPEAYEKAIKPKPDKMYTPVPQDDMPDDPPDEKQSTAEGEKKPVKTVASKKAPNGKKKDSSAQKEG